MWISRKTSTKTFDRVEKIEKSNITNQRKENITQRIRLALTFNGSLLNFYIHEKIGIPFISITNLKLYSMKNQS